MEAKWTSGDYNKMGQIDFRFHSRDGKLRLRAYKSDDAPLAVVNCYTQYTTGVHHLSENLPPIYYDALRLCMRKIGEVFEGKRVGLPAIGAGLAGGNWKLIKQIFKNEVASRCDLTVVLFKS
jgi:O-acetyl-ADP-ribose deacetylase (regulator of RNase III)